MHFLYIIFSFAANRYYVGETADIKKRILKHISKGYPNTFTKIARDWEIKLDVTCPDRETALFLEAFIKRMKSRKFIEKVIRKPEILDDLIKKK